ncbi:MAG TPA: DUF6259 domain-containing protein [Bryobacteraceae bacterium]|nr:DUF6259 domain-containing protein [Bryobacteraceae bacterium]
MRTCAVAGAQFAIASSLLIAVAAQPAPPDRVVLQSDSLQLTFTGDGRLAGFKPTRSSDNYLKAANQPPPLIAVNVGNPDGSGQIEAFPLSPRVSISNGAAQIDSDFVRSAAGDLPIQTRVAVQLATGSAESRWTVQIRNRDPRRTVFAITLPRLYGVRLGPDSADDELYLPYWGGERFSHAVKDFADISEKRLSPLETGSRRITRQARHYVRELTYAGGASMMWLDYLDGEHGLYLASYDPEFLVTVLHADTEGQSAGSMNFEFRKWVAVRPGESFTLAPFIVAAHGNDWHWAADQYRGWFRTQVSVPFAGGKWRQQVGGWLPFLKNAYGKIGYRFRDMPALWERERALGMDLLIPYGWSRGGFDSQDPEYYPDLDLGGPIEMARAWRRIREDGGQIMTYINARIFNRHSLYFPTLGEEAAVRNPDGTYPVETYSPGSPESFAVMCPGSAPWQKLLVDFGTAALTQYDSELIYYDQVAAAPPVACYSAQHGHNGPGLWNQEYRGFLRRAVETDRKLNPNVAFMIEGAADLYAPYALFQGYFCPRYAGTKFAFPELLKYTFPEIVQANFFPNPRNSPNTIYPGLPTLPHEAAIYWLARGILLGKLFAFIDPVTEDQAWWSEVARLLVIRKAAAPWMAHGVFRDTVDVAHADGALEVKTYRCRSSNRSSTLVAILNLNKRNGAKVAIRCDPKLPHLRAFRLEPGGTKEPVPLIPSRDVVTVTASTDFLSMIVIEGTGA